MVEIAEKPKAIVGIVEMSADRSTYVKSPKYSNNKSHCNPAKRRPNPDLPARIPKVLIQEQNEKKTSTNISRAPSVDATRKNSLKMRVDQRESYDRECDVCVGLKKV